MFLVRKETDLGLWKIVQAFSKILHSMSATYWLITFVRLSFLNDIYHYPTAGQDLIL